jgi:hypothetical protein
MARRFLKEKWQRVTAIVLASLITVVLIAAIFVNAYWSPILSDKLKDAVAKSSDGLYIVNFSSAELHVIRGTIDIYNIVLVPDTTIYAFKKKHGLAPNNLIELRVKRIVLSHIHPFSLYFHHLLNIGQVELDQPDIKISYELNHKKDTVAKDHKTVWEKISKSLHSIHIGNILLGDIKLKYKDYSGNKVEISELKEMDVTAHDLLIDSATQTDKSRILYCKDIIAELNDYIGKSPNGLYTYKVKHLRLSTQLSRLNAEGLSVKPVPADAFFTKSRTDKFTLNVDSLQLNNFDYLNYHKYRVCDASSLSLHGGSLEVFGNPNHTKQLTDRVITFPNAAIFLINADVKLDTIRLKRIAIYYSEYNVKDNKVGTISFNNTSGIVTNITTRPAAIEKNNFCNLDLTSYLMNRGKLNVHFTFNLADADKSFSYKGSLGAMNLKDINPAIRPLTMVKLNSGTIQRLDFDIQANRTGSHGTVRALYNDLNISLLKKDSMFNSLSPKPLISLYANIFIIKHNNPDNPGDVPRTAIVTLIRQPDVPFFKFVWQGLLTGLKPEIGLDKKTQDQTAEMIKQKAADKTDRQTRRAARQARRAARREKRAEKQQQAAQAAQ